ncbi:MAG: tRNA (adenosine(37)-N6)-dimethylallyltransferase MiaA [Salibacteraceae bacterium]
MTRKRPLLIVITGPTASGKTTFSIDVALATGAEIINCDSRQFYRGMDIGTAKPTSRELNQVKHHFIDIINPDQAYSAGAFADDVVQFLSGYFQSNQVAILCGGSGLYARSVYHGLANIPPAPAEIRAKWNTILANYGVKALAEHVLKTDPEAAEHMDMDNPQRLQRALEVWDLTGKLPYQHGQNPIPRPFDIFHLSLAPPRSLLYDKINQRVDIMMDMGLIDEAKALRPYRHCNALKTVGYKELFEHFDGKTSLQTAIEKIKQHTRNFAKRQYTWFRREPVDLYQTVPDRDALLKALNL